MRDLICHFLADSHELLDGAEQCIVRHERDGGGSELPRSVKTSLHTIKGNAGLLDLGAIGHAAHDLETALDEALSHREKRFSASGVLAAVDRLRGALNDTIAELDEPSGARNRSQRTVRVSEATLNQVLHDTFEIVLARNALADVAQRSGAVALRAPLQRLYSAATNLRMTTSDMALQPLGAAWTGAARMVRDIAASTGKDIALDTSGHETEVNRRLVEVARDCLSHLIRNAAVHGIESPCDRVAAGKSPRGTIAVHGAREGSHLVLTVRDDGCGMEAASAKQMATGVPADTISQLAGRGVGLDCVRSAVERHSGTVEVESSQGRGVCIRVRLPIDSEIVLSLCLQAGGQSFAIPHAALIEVQRWSGETSILSRGLRVPVIDLVAQFQLEARTGSPSGIVLVCEHNTHRFGLLIDGVAASEELIVAPLPAGLGKLKWYSGRAITGAGKPILVLDPAAFADIGAARHEGGRVAEAAPPVPTIVNGLLFTAGGPTEKIVALADIDRVATGTVHITPEGAQHVLIGHQRLPLRAAHPDMQLCRDEQRSVLVIGNGDASHAIAVDAIGDAVAARAIADGGGGFADVDGRRVELFDVDVRSPRRGDWRQEDAVCVGLSVPDALLRQMLIELLRANGFVVRDDDAPGMRCRFALVELDTHEPEFSNDTKTLLFDAANSLSRTKPRIIGLSGSRDARALQRAEALGALCVMSPFDRQSLVTTLQAVAREYAA